LPDFRAILLAVSPLLFSAAIMIVGNGLFGTLLAVRMDLEGVGVDRIGVILACYSVGFVAGTLICPWVVGTVGHIRGFAAFAALGATTALLHAMWFDEWVWGLLRMATGFSMACLYTIIESWLNAQSPNAVRGRVMSTYMAVNYVAYGLAQLLLTAMDPASFQLFSLVAILVSLSLVPLSLTPVEMPQSRRTARLGLLRLIRISPLGVAGCFAAGLVNSGFNSLAPVYARAVDPSPDWVAAFMMTAIFAGFILQFPMGRLSDRFDRRTVILWLTFAIAAVSVAAATAGPLSMWLLLPLVALYGGLVYTLYPICLSHANDFMEPGLLVPAAAGLLLTYGVGASLGPIVAAQAMGWLGTSGLFFYSAAIGILLALFTLWRMTRRAAKPNEEQSAFVAVPQTTPVVAKLDPRHVEDEAAA
jgi:MFS family permease